MDGVQQPASVETTTQVPEQFIDPCFWSWIIRHSERLAYERIMDDPLGVFEVAGSRRKGQNGLDLEYADAVPASNPTAKPVTLPTKFLISRERRDQLLRERAAWERPHHR